MTAEREKFQNAPAAGYLVVHALRLAEKPYRLPLRSSVSAPDPWACAKRDMVTSLRS